ncbi:hypothetical protein RND81_03G082300 [Saponaria officinalis]|uniref:Uncharacterized protein n=1 Tax=Saponaria officinalis TaxID=3572 RepID=A0AAW1LZD7_SAPOF
MASDEHMTEYERRRLENMKRNSEMLASLNVHIHLSDLSTSSKRLRQEKSYKQSSEKNKPEARSVIRRSLRARGMPPDTKGLPNSNAYTSKSNSMKLQYLSDPRSVVRGPLSMKDAYDMNEGSYRAIAEKFTNIKNSQSNGIGKRRTRSTANGVSRLSSEFKRVNLEVPIDAKSLNFEPDNIARVVPGRILSVRFIPTTDMTMVVAGNKYGHLGFWDVKPQMEDEDFIHLYQPHTAAISGIYVHPFSPSKVYTSSYDGFIRLMDIEREQFDLAYSSTSESALYSLSQQPHDANSIYIGEGKGGDLKVVDKRVGEVTNSWSLHKGRINTIDFTPTNPNIMATSSSDLPVCGISERWMCNIRNA